MANAKGDVERSRAEKAMLEAEMKKEADEIEACHLFFNSTGGADHWFVCENIFCFSSYMY